MQATMINYIDDEYIAISLLCYRPIFFKSEFDNNWYAAWDGRLMVAEHAIIIANARILNLSSSVEAKRVADIKGFSSEHPLLISQCISATTPHYRASGQNTGNLFFMTQQLDNFLQTRKDVSEYFQTVTVNTVFQWYSKVNS